MWLMQYFLQGTTCTDGDDGGAKAGANFHEYHGQEGTS
jgi:hypothetical protein